MTRAIIASTTMTPIATSRGMRKEFSVAQFHDDGSHEYVGRWMSDAEAVEMAAEVIVMAGTAVTKIIITDGGDDTVFQWERGLGITWPTPELWLKPSGEQDE